MSNHYDVLVVGGGISGTALFYELARYTDIERIALLEKYPACATLNSKGTSNSQTIHCGDIETNYTFEKAKSVKKSADMIVKYALMHGYENKFMFAHQKMVIGVGDTESEAIRARFEKFKELYTSLEIFDKEKLKQIEPMVVRGIDGNDRKEQIVAMGVGGGEYTTVDFEQMSNSLIKHAKEANKTTDVFFDAWVKSIKKQGDRYLVKTRDGRKFNANYVVVNAGAHSLYLAHMMGLGLEFSCLPIAGSFYMSKKRLLRGKVYTVQNPKLPFAAIHGDPDILADGLTRFGPTALVLPKLERYRGNSTVVDFVRSLRLDSSVMSVLTGLFKDGDIREYVMRNFAYEVPMINKILFVKAARKIVPSLKSDDVYYARNFGGVRPQVIDKKSKELMLGEASINTGDGIIFNMTPSPGATSCLANGFRDARRACEFLGRKFNEDRFNAELVD
ncbi:FAD-dependent oxidoreductase [Campylobacter sp. RM16192]|uniref:FAD-dependent oxidoreductase n=1 Tax=Campylobacter sp. RM16192 TaxID=1660080 RepID=UPI0014510BE0|nr:FAD-dependent oxidoreductase [Campylobacter sp. RM16192]QCD51785.1 malate:quinone-oxidoreductase [Campylobacter sp. RM16192]